MSAWSVEVQTLTTIRRALTLTLLPQTERRTYQRVIDGQSPGHFPGDVTVGDGGHPRVFLRSEHGLDRRDVGALSWPVVADSVIINQLLSERIESGRQLRIGSGWQLQMMHVELDRDGITYDEARHRQAESIAAKRFGRPGNSAPRARSSAAPQAGYISGQNLHVDGGSYPGLI